MLTEKGKDFMRGVILYGMFLGLFWEALFGWKATIQLIAYLLGYQITPL